MTEILPATIKAKAEHDFHGSPEEKAKCVSVAVEENIKLQTKSILAASPIVSAMVEANHLLVVPAVYSFETGLVTRVE